VRSNLSVRSSKGSKLRKTGLSKYEKGESDGIRLVKFRCTFSFSFFFSKKNGTSFMFIKTSELHHTRQSIRPLSADNYAKKSTTLKLFKLFV
jgi:hypothetical protein